MSLHPSWGEVLTDSPSDWTDHVSSTMTDAEADELARELGLSGALQATQHLSIPTVTALSQSIPLVGQYFFQDHPKTHLSKEGVGQVVGVAAEMVEDSLSHVVNSLLHIEKGSRAALEAALDCTECQPIMYLDLARYDETPMKVTHKEFISKLALSNVPESDQSQGSHLQAPDVGFAKPELIAKAATSSKMFFAEGRVSMLVKASMETEGGLETQFLVISGADLSWKQILERDTAGCQFKALLQTNQVTCHSEKFGLKVRLCTTDQAGANFNSEKHMAHSRGSGWCGLHLACHVHITSRIMKRTLSFVDAYISGMLSVSLALSEGASMHRFRKALAQVISERITFTNRHLSADALAYKDYVLKTFCSTGTSQELRRELLKTFASGDWRKTGVFEHYVPPGAEHNEQHLKMACTKAMLLALTPSLFKLYPRHRWGGL